MRRSDARFAAALAPVRGAIGSTPAWARAGFAALLAIAAVPGCGFSSRNDGGAGGGDDQPPDAPPDSPSGVGFCYGPSGWDVCFDAVPTGAVTLSGSLDTDKSDAANPCLKAQPASWRAAGQPESCVIAGATISIATLKVTGKRPLVLVGAQSIAINALLDVGSHRVIGIVRADGAGAQPADCQPFKLNPGNGAGGGGGAGGSFTTQAGNGGTGDRGGRQNGQAANADIGSPSRLRGGCAGQPGAGARANDSGAGGGAVYLVSGGAINLMGTIDAAGAGGLGSSAGDGGSGGGSGGMVVLYGASINALATSLILVTGGGGGGGGASAGPPLTARGIDGDDPQVEVPVTAADGGLGGLMVGGTGGNGGNGYPASSSALDGTGGENKAGGGGGGGAAGYVQTNRDLAPATVSPPPLA